MSIPGFYRAFEERFYAPRDVIKRLRRQYLPFVEPLVALYPQSETFDIGCGRGEWLELMGELGFNSFGVDLDEGMLQDCRDFNLRALQGDAVAYLKTLADESQAVITAFHVVEHISFEQLQAVVIESHRALKPGGLLIMETPNPENIAVATRNFYLDPTHQRVIPPLLLGFLPEFHGFARVGTLRLQESHELRDSTDVGLMDVIAGVSPDYAVVAQKAAAPDVLAAFDPPFNARYGLELPQLAGRYDRKVEGGLAVLSQRLTEAEAAVGRTIEVLNQLASQHAQLEQLRAQAESAQAQRDALLQSRSWRITSPLRWGASMLYSFSLPVRKTANFVLRHALNRSQGPLSKLMGVVLRSPFSHRINAWLLRFPHLHKHLSGIAQRNGIAPHPSYLRTASRLLSKPIDPSLAALTPRARRIHAMLNNATKNTERRQ
ncbi:class I SAM-dependent methyltransferase [Ottowia thiooxydans]|uniref:SAM-dependent methyltransferase n=1 Tax=Ottowia thiooxydans TaxID=219182 RepID=A0ABV2QD35_9BURK